MAACRRYKCFRDKCAVLDGLGPRGTAVMCSAKGDKGQLSRVQVPVPPMGAPSIVSPHYLWMLPGQLIRS